MAYKDLLRLLGTLKIFVIGGYADSLIRFRGDMLKDMVALGHKVFACAPCADDSVKLSLEKIGVDYIEVPIDRTGVNPFNDLKTLVAIVSLLRRHQPDVVLSYTIKPVIYGSIAAHINRIPMICSMITGLGYSFAYNSWKARIVNIIVRLLYMISLSFNERVFFQNTDNKDLFCALGLIRDANKAVLINGSGVNLYQYPVVDLPDCVNFLLIARLIQQKGIREYVESARIIKDLYPNVNFLLVGWIDENPGAITRDELQSWVDEGYIEYLGFLEDVRPALAKSSVFVLPTYYPEGIPRTILEALATGRPIITTDMPGCRETVTHGYNGVLVPARDPRELAKAMEFFIRDPKVISLMGKRSREIAEKKYDVRKVNSIILYELGLVDEETEKNI